MPRLDLTRTPPSPPKAQPVERTLADGSVVTDPYHWLTERENPEVLAYLASENAHTDTFFAAREQTVDLLAQEIAQRVNETDASAPVLDGPYVYYRRTLAGASYPIHARRRVPEGITDVDQLTDELRFPVDPFNPPTDEQVLIDENEAASGHDYFRLGVFAPSPDHQRVIEGIDTTGGEVFTLTVRDLNENMTLPDVVENASYGVAWDAAGTSFLYTTLDDAWRPYRVYRHVVGTDQSDDLLLHEETDERFFVGVGLTRSGAFQVIHAGSKITDEWRLIDAWNIDATPQLVIPRTEGVQVDLDHGNDTLFFLTNADDCDDFELRATPLNNPTAAATRVLFAHQRGVRLESLDVFGDHLVLGVRRDATTNLIVLAHDGTVIKHIGTPGDLATTVAGGNPQFHTHFVRTVTTALATPTVVTDIAVNHDTAVVVKRQDVPGGFREDAYETWRSYAVSDDGIEVPISLVAKRDRPKEAPCLIYVYGAYEISLDPAFSTARLNLLDRGVVFALAHVRGGGDQGRQWYETGKFAAKPNTFKDTVACANHLADTPGIDPTRIAIRGGSAGGLTVGAALNRAPERFCAAVAEVPFVDVAATLSDPSLPLTVIEYDEWGDPRDPKMMQIIRSYSPVDNVEAHTYPPLYITAGLNDPRVQYFEPAKWVATLRSRSLDPAILFFTEMGSGHGGRSGRYDAWRDEAQVHTFLLDMFGIDVVR
ncbi:MAG: S9 family peptidase [Nitriliruptoraceae bacterium]